MTRGRIFLTALVVLIICLGLGYAWGASGRRIVQAALEDSRQQLDLAEARGALLDARVSLYNNNFGDASRRLEEAKVPLRKVKDRFQDAGTSDAAASIDAALGHIDEAQRLAGKLDPAANTRAGEALEAIRVATQK
ncbi:MAG TPA: hypothetical protein VM791_09395 [Vicinamibacterales bacterium]|jgi:hypothetical protein|nr:hypothetical protein [Vicinamibacterales bacterium]